MNSTSNAVVAAAADSNGEMLAFEPRSATPDPFNNGAPLDPLDNLGPRSPEPASMRPSDQAETEIESVIACLGDDAAALRDENPESEVAANMERAAELLGLGVPGQRVASDEQIIAAVRAATPRKPVSDEQIASFLPVWRAFATALAPALQMKEPLTDAGRDVLAERQRQISAEGWTPAHDDGHEEGELSMAAAGYAISASDQIQCVAKELDDSTIHDSGCANSVFPHGWTFKPASPRRMLVKAAALILAEIERLDRAAEVQS